MISSDDIEAMQDDIHPDVSAAMEYWRRWRKGIPSDRWTDGHKGAVQVARGIERMMVTVAKYIEDDARRSADSIEPHKDPMRTRGKHEGPFGQGGTG